MKSHTFFPKTFYCILLITLFFSNLLVAQDAFEEFPWLSDIVNTEDCCENQQVKVYQKGIYQFIYIEKGEACAASGNTLYFQNGDFYCADLNGMDCRAAYELSEENSRIIYTCESAKLGGCENVLEADWIQEFLDSECTGKVYSFEYKEESLVYLSTLCACLDDADLVFNCQGEEVCFFGGLADPTVGCSPEIQENLTEENLIWSPACDCGCPVANTPVCGVDGNTYESACEATCAGVEILDQGECKATINCAAFDEININPSYCDGCISEISIYLFEGEHYVVSLGDNRQCSDAQTTVINCDSTVVFCYDGGFAGFTQCEKFFEQAEKVEIKWSKAKDCNGEIKLAEPCTDVGNVDFGKCEAIMGIALKDGECTFVSGCLDYIVDGVDYSNAFFPSVEICQQSCGLSIPEEKDTSTLFFEGYPWLTEVLDTNNCERTIVEVYDFGSYKFLYVDAPEGGSLYYEDGTFYCVDQPNYDCRTLYNLKSEHISTLWVCGKGRTTPTPKDPQASPRNGSNFTHPPVFNAFPNPTGGTFKVAITPHFSETQWLTVYNLYGQQIDQVTISPNSSVAVYNFDLSNANAGIYLVEWRTASDKKVQKIIRQ